MSTQAAETSVRHSIVVEAPVEIAFSVFTEGFDSFKPREHNMLEVDIRDGLRDARGRSHLRPRRGRQ